VFVHDRQARRTVRVSVGAGGVQANGDLTWPEPPAISADGLHVAFASDATNLVPGDTNGNGDLFIRDWKAGRTTRVSVSTAGAQSNHYSREAAISGNGRFVTFVSAASTLDATDDNGFDDVFLRDRVAGTTTRISQPAGGGEPNNTSYNPALSPNGRYIAFDSYASNLTPGDTNDDADVFVYDRTAGTTERVSVSSAGDQGNYASYESSISADGRFVSFNSGASNLVPSDNNGRTDVFIRDRKARTTALVSVATDGTQGNGLSRSGVVSGNGKQVLFHSVATNLISGDTNNAADLFVRRLLP
jgi:Tol biopolymer transport system component